MTPEDIFEKLHNLLDGPYLAMHAKIKELVSSGGFEMLVKLSGLTAENGSDDHREIRDKGNLVTSLMHLESALRDTDPLKHQVKDVLHKITDVVRRYYREELGLGGDKRILARADLCQVAYSNEAWLDQMANVLINDRVTQR